jgi:hypothetical protein
MKEVAKKIKVLADLLQLAVGKSLPPMSAMFQMILLNRTCKEEGERVESILANLPSAQEATSDQIETLVQIFKEGIPLIIANRVMLSLQRVYVTLRGEKPPMWYIMKGLQQVSTFAGDGKKKESNWPTWTVRENNDDWDLQVIQWFADWRGALNGE